MGLYDDLNAAVVSGDADSKEYWYARFASEKLEEALKSRQPEGAVRDFLPEAIAAHDAALKVFPNHLDVKKWKARALEVQKKIDSKARLSNWRSDFPWGDDRFMQGWVEVNWARLARGQNLWDTVHTLSLSAKNHLGEYGAQRNMRGWREEMQKLVREAHKEVAALYDESIKHR